MYVHILSALLVQLALSQTTKPPCCRDHIGATTCQRLNKSYPRMFSRRCNSDVEFRLIQCCSTCNSGSEALAYDVVAKTLLSEQCSDRYGTQFCSSYVQYVNSTDVFEPQGTWTCESEHPQIAFRACRKSCGFCDLSVVEYTLENAQNACKKKSSGFKEKRPW